MKIITRTTPGQGAILRLLALEFLALALQLMRMALGGEVASKPEYILITLVSIGITAILAFIGLPSKVLSVISILYLNGMMVFSIIFNIANNYSFFWMILLIFILIIYSYQQSIVLINKDFLFFLLGVNVICLGFLLYSVSTFQVTMLTINFILFGGITYFVYEWHNNQQIISNLKSETTNLRTNKAQLQKETDSLQRIVTVLEKTVIDLQISETQLQKETINLQNTIEDLNTELTVTRQRNKFLTKLLFLVLQVMQKTNFARVYGTVDSHPKTIIADIIQFWLEGAWGPVFVRWLPLLIKPDDPREIKKGDFALAIGIPGGQRKKEGTRMSVFWAFYVHVFEDETEFTKTFQEREQGL